MVEVALIKLTRPSMEPDMDSVLQRLKQLEAAVEDLEAGGCLCQKQVCRPRWECYRQMQACRECSPKWQLSRCRQQARRVFHQEMLLKQQALSRQTRSVFPQAQLEDLNLIRNEWAKIVRSAGGSARACFRDTVVEPGGEGCLTIVFLDSMSYDMGKASYCNRPVRTAGPG